MVSYINEIELINLASKEKQFLKDLYKLPLFLNLCNLCLSKNVKMKTEIIRNEVKQNCVSALSISFFDERGKILNEPDEPSASIFIFEPICYKKKNKLFFVNLVLDSEFLNQLSTIIEQINLLSSRKMVF